MAEWRLDSSERNGIQQLAFIEDEGKIGRDDVGGRRGNGVVVGGGMEHDEPRRRPTATRAGEWKRVKMVKE